ncbi:hypothetical protein cypCar_00012317 [Cyprinus carpio]|nr:hypothetical protein cypCar_00012317 [Cyprinus carpio]
MATRIDKEACREAYNLVRDDTSDICWASFQYDGSTIVPAGHGSEYEEFKSQCTDDNRLFGFVRITTGDAMSKRAKFTLITWIGENVSGLQRAKISTDKTLVKDIVQVGFAFSNSIAIQYANSSTYKLQHTRISRFRVLFHCKQIELCQGVYDQ